MADRMPTIFFGHGNPISDAERSIPTPEHYLPLLYVLGASEEGEVADFPTRGVDGGSMSMLSIRLG